MSEPSFRGRLLSGTPIAASFVKTNHYQQVELAGAAGLDAIVLDAEHAAFSAADLDVCLLACKAAGVAGLVRVPDTRAATLLQVFDMGADGVLVPHVASAAQAAEIVALTRYMNGTRGFSNSARAGRYGRAAMREHIDQQDNAACVICQIEDEAALAELDAIAAVDGIDALFVGRADLSVSMRTYDVDAPAIAAATRETLAAADRARKAGGLFVGDTGQIRAWRDAGASFFVIGSDQSTLRAGWQRAVNCVRAGS
ncbi:MULTISPECIES: HpcH/HpaI aldolase/citrate lyase family protein [unclassified Burkholderia]|uniref:HpcH/HpaI aldolase family protein n=1 Tax=unclassified Burkholderia TaxID=2613784 RepID=UPI000F58887E|nr:MULTISPECIES: aldolase/citrate lyase family protein [unclassified Burkholderia]RQS26450.1 aldolase [Burkholderia sp. Bp8995]RQS48428.1 aldolase [Burkholderia sp. Bp8989]